MVLRDVFGKERMGCSFELLTVESLEESVDFQWSQWPSPRPLTALIQCAQRHMQHS